MAPTRSIGYRAVELAASTIRQWYNNISVFHARYAVRGRHADRQPRRHHGPGVRVLREATLIAAEDTRRTAHLLARYAIATPTTSLHEHNEAKQERGARRAADARRKHCARVGRRHTDRLGSRRAARFGPPSTPASESESVPGPSAALAALAASGLPVGHVLVYGLSANSVNARSSWLEHGSNSRTNACVLRGPSSNSSNPLGHQETRWEKFESSWRVN